MSDTSPSAYVYRTLSLDELILLYHHHDIQLSRYILDNQHQYPKELVNYCYNLENNRLHRQLNTVELDIIFNQPQSPLRPILFNLIKSKCNQFHYDLVTFVNKQVKFA